jgi:hypothetical protein
MGKKNKAKKDNGNNKTISLAGLKDIFTNAKTIVDSAPKDANLDVQTKIENVQSDIKTISDIGNKLSDDEKKNFEQLLNDLKSAIEAYKESKKTFDTNTAELGNFKKTLDNQKSKQEQKEADLKEFQESLKKQESTQNTKESKLFAWENELKTKNTEIGTREINVSKKEAEADAGFQAKALKWEKESVDKFNKEIESIKANLESERARYIEVKKNLEKDQEKCQIELESYKEKKSAYDDAKTNLENYYKEQLQQKETEHQDELNRILDSKKKLQEQLNQFNDIRAELGGKSASEIKHLIEKYREENAKLQLDIQQTGSAEYQQALEEELQKCKDECDSLIIEKNQLEAEKRQLRKKIVDNEGLIALNRTLETHKKALEAAQEQLQNKLDELTSKDANKEIFAEFKSIDNNCSIEYSNFTHSDKNLKTFINAIGYRLTQYTPHLFYTPETLQLFVGGLAMSRLILLQGISGTGKTKLAQAFASIVGDNIENSATTNNQEKCSCIVPVQAGWRDNQDLLGYYNAFEKKFYEKPFSKGLYTASTPSFKEKLFFIILDEMNLSHPEQYFADFISAMEQANSVSDKFEVDLLSGISNEIMEKKELWPKYLNKEKIIVPSNVWFIGTANHDETTMEFADKTYDRAHVMVMERNTQRHQYHEVQRGAAHWSASDLREAFVNAQNSQDGKNQSDWVKNKLETLKDILKKEFDVSFGNRLERQIENFVPVVCAAGGTQTKALDHLIATKIVRKGKITGLFGVQKESLENLRDEILTGIGLNENSQTIKLLDQDITAKDRGN